MGSGDAVRNNAENNTKMINAPKRVLMPIKYY